MIFQNFSLLSHNPLLDYSYSALSTEGQGETRLLLKAVDLICLEVPANETDLEELCKDYLPTLQKIEYDLNRL